MAIGLGLMLGFVFAKNFDSPYRAESITDFWRRWHISLSTWLRDYLYIPLGGNRKRPRRAPTPIWSSPCCSAACGTARRGLSSSGAACTAACWRWSEARARGLLSRASRSRCASRSPSSMVLLGWVFFRAAEPAARADVSRQHVRSSRSVAQPRTSSAASFTSRTTCSRSARGPRRLGRPADVGVDAAAHDAEGRGLFSRSPGWRWWCSRCRSTTRSSTSFSRRCRTNPRTLVGGEEPLPPQHVAAELSRADTGDASRDVARRGGRAGAHAHGFSRRDTAVMTVLFPAHDRRAASDQSRRAFSRRAA